MGQGSMSGRAFGFCAGYDSPGYAKGFGGEMSRGFGFGRGMGHGRGFGFGRNRNWGWFRRNVQAYPQAMGKEDEIRMLKSQSEAIKCTQADIEKRIQELEDKNK
jgi:hypothetical protein